jgi:hypothetical protein
LSQIKVVIDKLAPGKKKTAGAGRVGGVTLLNGNRIADCAWIGKAVAPHHADPVGEAGVGQTEKRLACGTEFRVFGVGPGSVDRPDRAYCDFRVVIMMGPAVPEPIEVFPPIVPMLLSVVISSTFATRTPFKSKSSAYTHKHLQENNASRINV